MNQSPFPPPDSPLIRRAIACLTHEAASIEEAVEMATRFRSEGKYDWFRGQSHDWPLYPSASRRGNGPKEQKTITDEQLLLLSWLRQTSGLSELANDVDAVLSIAQHHGLPTSLLDFTTDPGIAGFFAASDGQENFETGFIYCLNTAELRRFDREMREYSADYRVTGEIAFIQVDVPNLWRMEAQHGALLFAPSNFFDYYLIDKISFPHPSRLSFPTAKDVYPERKSPLELELDHFFDILANSRFHEEFRKVFPEAKIHNIELPPNRVEPEFFKRGTLPKMPCWNKASIELWRSIPTERLRCSPFCEIGLDIDLRSEACELRSRVSFGISRALSLDSSLRKKAVNWVILPQRRLQARLRGEIDRVWNGMRFLPYEDATIADAIGLCFALHRKGFREATDEEAKVILSELLGDSMKVGLGDGYGTSSYGYISTADLLCAIRSDIHLRLLKRNQKYLSSATVLLQMCSSPDRLFMFAPFARLFGAQIVPTQIMGAESRGAFYSPARINAFGLP